MKEKAGCGVVLFILLLNVTIGAWSVDYILNWFSRDIPWIGDAVIGLFVGELSIPVAIIGWILQLFGVF